MKLAVHGSLGDQIMLTGIPEAYFSLTGENTQIFGDIRKELWETNPFINDKAGGDEFSYAFNQGKDYLAYYPTRIFYDLTGMYVHRDLVQPNLYKGQKPRKEKMVVINDQAGWPSRRGYQHFETLSKALVDDGYYVIYERHENAYDCFGQKSPSQLETYSEKRTNLPLEGLINLLLEADFYIGYDSGTAQLAGALKTKYVFLTGSVPAINTMHNSCILSLEFCYHCVSPRCDTECLQKAPDCTNMILDALNRHKWQVNETEKRS